MPAAPRHRCSSPCGPISSGSTGRRPARRRPWTAIAERLRRDGVRAVAANGVLGDPAGASAAEGAALLDRLVDDLAAAVDGWLAVADVGAMTTYALDATTRRPAGSNVVIGGSPLRLFRLSDAGVGVFDDLAAGHDVGADPPTTRLVDRLVDAGAIHPRPTGGPFTAADVSVVVPALVLGESALAEIVRCCPGVAVVIAVDDASDPPVSAVPGARVLRLRTNAGPAVARNAGLGAVETPLIAFVDTDVRLEPGWLDPLLPHFADDRVGARRAAGRQRAGRRPGRRLRAGPLPARPRSRGRAHLPRAPG